MQEFQAEYETRETISNNYQLDLITAQKLESMMGNVYLESPMKMGHACIFVSILSTRAEEHG